MRTLSILRKRIQDELRGLLGRSEKSLRLFQDAEAIPSGSLWESAITEAIDKSVFFVPIITPRVVNSLHCQEEFQKFLEREKYIGRNDLVFPIIYIEVSELEEESQWRAHPFLKNIGVRQFVDWTELRFEIDGSNANKEIAKFCKTIVNRLRAKVEYPIRSQDERILNNLVGAREDSSRVELSSRNNDLSSLTGDQMSFVEGVSANNLGKFIMKFLSDRIPVEIKHHGVAIILTILSIILYLVAMMIKSDFLGISMIALLFIIFARYIQRSKSG